MTDFVVVLSTCASAQEAETLARHLLEKRLAACVNVAPAGKSIYRWKGAIEEASEHLLVIKSRRPLLRQLEKELSKVHSYEVPELVVLAVVDGSRSYLEWLERELPEESTQ
ncbi:MAG: divalent-cation tolerance protein CutA [Bryobacteraceae bacterium]|nr:divalent-cation tolerance protein CutA [Bryobacteraceae bacterium]MDW8379212.1 divalent-cation tolerance protein CutA [Bryobacterales bacterium]